MILRSRSSGGYIAFGAVVGWLVVVLSHEVIRRVLLGCHPMRFIMGVLVALAMSQLFGARIVRVAQMHGDAAAETGTDVGNRLVQAHVRRIRLGGGGKVDNGFGGTIRPSGIPIN